MEDHETDHRTELNEHQERWLRVTFERIDQVLGEIETVLEEPATTAAFPRHIQDVTPARRRMIEEALACIRVELVQSMIGMNIAVRPASIPASRAINVALISIDDTAEELRPVRMQRYAAISRGTAADLDRAADRLQSLVRDLRRALENDGTT